MPAGVVKTPKTGRAKDATPQGAKSADRTGSGGKKFVQTRLPFKLIAPVAKSAGPAGATAASPGAAAAAAGGGASSVAVIDLDSDEVELTPEQQQPRKRKLSYSGTDKESSDTSKENLETGGKKPKTTTTTTQDSEDVIELVDDDEDEAAVANDSVTAVAEEKKATKPKGRKSGTGSTPVQIKLPLSNKRAKRRKSLKKSVSEQLSEEQQTAKAAEAVERSDSSDDIEAIAEELNPLKRAKVSAAEGSRSSKENEAAKAGEEEDEELDVENDTLEEVNKLEEKGKPGKKSQAEEKAEPSKGKPKTEEKVKAGKKPQTEKAEQEEKAKLEEKPKPGKQPQSAKKAKLEEKAKLEGKPKTDEKHNKEELPKLQTKSTEQSKPLANSKKEEKVQEQSKKEKQSKLVEHSKQEKPKKEEQSKQKKTKLEEQSKANQSDADLAMDVDSDEMLVESSDGEHKSDDVASTDIDMDVDVDVDTETLNHTSPEKDKEKQGQDDELSEVEANKSAVAAVVGAEKATKTLTPKQQRLMEQRRKAREEKERKLQEERRLKQQEKEEREQQKKQEREQKEEQRRKEREDKEQQRRQEREEKERKRLAENEEKERKRQAENEEKRKRNEAKEEVQRKKDEERRRKEQEKEEAEQKKKRAAATFSKFFVPKQPRQSVGGSMDHDQNSCDSGPSSSQTLAFRPFQIKDDMIMAPVIRASIPSETRRQLDKLFHVTEAGDGDDDDDDDLNESIGRVKRPTRAQLYLAELSLGKHKPQRGKRDARLQRRSKDEEEDDDVLVVDELDKAGTPIVEERPKQVPWMRAKYLHFADNRRPPYYGTWRKRSQVISARHPLGQDKAHFDYEVDSDCEWEEEEPGESLSASEDEKERESEEESEEEYNEWFVPHGHLSDEELQNDGELEDGNTREAQKAKLQVLQQEFAQEMKKQTKKIKPRLLGPVWLDENGQKSQLCPAVFTQTIEMYGCWQLQPLTLEPPPEAVAEEDAAEESKTVKPSTMQLDEPLLQQLVRLIHGNSNSKVFLISEYLEYLKLQLPPDSTLLLPSKTLLREKFDEMAIWKAVELDVDSKKKKPKKRLCWLINSETLHKYQLDDLTVKNEWNYTLTPKTSKADTSLREASPPEPSTEATPTTTTTITTTTSTPTGAPRVATATATATASASSTGTPSGTKKRATLLMSVPRDQQFHAPTKNALISQYLRKQNDAEAEKKKKSPAAASLPSDDVVLLSD